MTRVPLWIAVLVLVAFVLAPVTVVVSRVYSLPAVPADATLEDQQVLGQCANGKLMIRHIWKLKDGNLMGVIKTPNGATIVVMKFKQTAEGKHEVVEVYVGNEKLTRAEASARYPDACVLLDQRNL